MKKFKFNVTSVNLITSLFLQVLNIIVGIYCLLVYYLVFAKKYIWHYKECKKSFRGVL